MVYKKKTWKEKLENSKDFPKVVEVDDENAKRWGGKKVVIPPPKEVDRPMSHFGISTSEVDRGKCE